MGAQPGPLLLAEFHSLPVLVPRLILEGERRPPGLGGMALGRRDVCLELHRVGARRGDRVDEGVGRSEAPVMGLRHLADHERACSPVQRGSPQSHGSRLVGPSRCATYALRCRAVPPLRIAHVVSTFPPYFGGAGTAAFETAAELARRGHEVEVFTARTEGTLP